MLSDGEWITFSSFRRQLGLAVTGLLEIDSRARGQPLFWM
jgi:hypothetical protein